MNTEVYQKLLRPAWFEIDLDALKNNFQETARLVGREVKIIGALKCDAYGFGYLEVAEEIISLGAYGVAVADLFEAVNLRERGIKAPILLYANNLPSTAETVIKYNLIPTVVDAESAEIYSKHASSPLSVFVKVDVGLQRIGVLPEEAVPLVEKIAALKHIVINGIYTHFHFSENDEYMNWQLDQFKSVVNRLEAKGIEIPIKMASATPSILQFPQTYFNCVDPGRLLFGNPVVAQPRQGVQLKPVFRSLKVQIIAIKTIHPRMEFEDEAPFPVPGNMRVGIIPIGWGDGYSRKHSLGGQVLVHGKRIPVLNGINFEHTRINLTSIPEARIGDEAVLIGIHHDEEISLEEVKKIRTTDLHEVCQSVRNHISRLYIKNGKPYKLKTPLGETFFNS
ncbi:MAG: alanine racemase [Deltaproteobacteria bacterium]|nr:alanine racemase [Deltaproteobacteria bacterium]